MVLGFNETSALQELFNDLRANKKELKENYRKDLAELERREFEVLERLRYLDERSIAQEKDATRKTLANLEQMEIPKNFGPITTEAPAKLYKGVTMKEAAERAAAAAEKVASTQSNAADNLSEPMLPAEPINKLADALAPDLPVQDPVNKIFTGIKEGFDKVKRYQCFYYCDNQRCRHKGKHFIEPSTTKVYCHECGRSLAARPATSKGWPAQDSFNNFFIAGARKTEEEIDAERNATPMESVENVLKNYEKERAEKSPAPSSSKRVGPLNLTQKKAEPAAAGAAK